MPVWQQQIQTIIDEIDARIRARSGTDMTLSAIARNMGYSESHFSRKFSEISGMQFRDYLRGRKLAFALKELRDTRRAILDIALDYGFSSHEAFTRAFRDAYGITPSQYRLQPAPVALRTIIRPFDCYLLGCKGAGADESAGDVNAYFVSIPAHRFLHIRNYESIGYYDFWEKQSRIPGQDCTSICGLLDSIPDKLDDLGADDLSSGSGQVMAYINEPEGRICSWGIPLAEAYGVRLPADYSGEIPAPLQMTDIPEGEYIVFEHGPFDFETQCRSVEERIETAMQTFDYSETGYRLDTAPGRIFYYYHDPARYWKYIRPVCRCT